MSPPVRLAWFSPVPPVRSGISAYTGELLPLLGADFAIDVFVDDPPIDSGSRRAELPRCPDGAAGLHSAHAFVHRHTLSPYDLVVYQLGNARCHDYMWAYLLRYPGLVVLHDAVLHHSRARALLARGRKDDYRAEFRFAHPDADPRLAEVAVAGLQGSTYYLWPLARAAVSASRVVAVHSEAVAAELRGQQPGARVERIRMGVPEVRATRKAAAGGLVFASYGLVTPEKRIPQVFRAFATIVASHPAARLLLVGDTTPHYDAAEDIRALGLDEHVIVTGFVPDEELPTWIASADVCFSLRWPTARETSASWLRCLAAGKPTIVTELAHTVEVPVLDPRDWRLSHARTDAAAAHNPPAAREAVAVGIDILDEDHSLALAARRLAGDATLRDMLGRNAHAWWATHHTPELMAADYRHVIEVALATPPPRLPPGWPGHLREDGTATLRAIGSEIGVKVDL